MAIKEILQQEGQGRKLQSNLTPIARMGAPVRSWQSRAADMMQEPDNSLGLLGSKGNWVSGLASAVKSGLGFYGAMKDMENQKAYNENLAQMAEQERQDKLAQQQFENYYKTNALAQQKELAQMNIDAANARANTARSQAIADRNAQWAHEKELRDLALKQQGIDPTKYGTDEKYTQQVIANQAAREAEKQRIDTLNKLAESGKYSYDDVQKVINEPGRYSLVYDKPSALTAFFGRNTNRLKDNGSVANANFGVQGETNPDNPMGFVYTNGLNKL